MEDDIEFVNTESDKDRVIREIKTNKQRRQEGKLIAIPFPFPKFGQHVAGIRKRRYIIVTANSKVGKTKIADFVFVYSPIRYIIDNPNCGLDITTKYFSLELSKNDKIKQLISHLLFTEHDIIISEEEVDSIYDRYILEDDILRKIESLEPLLERILSKIEFVDNIRNPFGIYKYVREWHEKNGVYMDKENKPISLNQIKNTDPRTKEQAQNHIAYYKPNNEDLIFEVVTDHVGLLTTEKNSDLRETIGNFSSNYCIKMRDRWDAVVINVQQQAASQEGTDAVKLSMTKPSANGLGINKNTQQDCDSIFGLYAPVRLDRREYKGFNIGNPNNLNIGNEPLLDNHREFLIILQRRGGASFSTQLLFLGQSTYFKELPEPTDNVSMIKLNEFIRRVRKESMRTNTNLGLSGLV